MRRAGNALYSRGVLFDTSPELTVEHLSALCFGRTERSTLEAYVHDVDDWWGTLRLTDALVRGRSVGARAPRSEVVA
ncbi:hypothetical protein [Streptomyces sp. NPDC050704]|uniref:hypothetical protein n=1 Tax=Streptomyces sp. NPDC050704 TaxID=3157219 RepID=UPI00341C4C2D